MGIGYRQLFRKSIDAIKRVIDVAFGRESADLVLENATLVNVVTGEILDRVSIAIADRYIAIVSEERVGGIRALNSVDLRGMYIVPGFIDAHVHIESSFLSPEEFSRVAELHGTTLAVIDPHELANIGGRRFLELLLEFITGCGDRCIKLLVQIPSCVPPSKDSYVLDTPGSILSMDDIAILIEKGFHSLGEVMDFESIVNGDEDTLNRVIYSLDHGLRVYGHMPVNDIGALNIYFSTGISSDHEISTYGEFVERVRRGVYAMVRGGGAWDDVSRIIPGIAKSGIDTRRLILVTDDISVIDLVEKGYMDRVVREAIEYGLDPVRAIQAVTINPAEYLRIDDYVGIIAPGRFADMVILRDLRSVDVFGVIRDGVMRVWNGDRVRDIDTRKIDDSLAKQFRVMNVNPMASWRDLVISAPDNVSRAIVRVIVIRPGETISRAEIAELPIYNGYIASDPSRGILHIAVVDRYRASRDIGKGFIKIVPMARRGAIAQSYAHDTHNIVVIGSDPINMYIALNEVVRIGGGIAVVADEKPVAVLDLGIGGVMSVKPLETVYRFMKSIENSVIELFSGAPPRDFLISLSLISLTVIPEVRLTTKGLVDVSSRRVIDVVVRYM
ncbi:Adenine deaminase [Ignisphaera aggregans DSM 17230]|uniref:Adenine deaminase n=1 Tax=Ignisphaera aggregans (strain DSM 17230 / JCM 13409 / AQ1.S1) TaxID=583356 RepID=E0STV5_IGNAA|nr:Adenine deaminase [Ignisphaera aggregans DSM 17230]